MNIDKYRMLLEAVDTGSLSQAAEKFDYTPSGMVHIVNSLEQEVLISHSAAQQQGRFAHSGRGAYRAHPARDR